MNTLEIHVLPAKVLANVSVILTRNGKGSSFISLPFDASHDMAVQCANRMQRDYTTIDGMIPVITDHWND